MPTSSSAMGPSAEPNTCRGLSTTSGKCRPVCASNRPARMGSGTGWMMPFFTASSTVHAMGRGAAKPARCCSRASASSKTMVAPVSRISECSEISVSSVTSPAWP